MVLTPANVAPWVTPFGAVLASLGWEETSVWTSFYPSILLLFVSCVFESKKASIYLLSLLPVLILNPHPTIFCLFICHFAPTCPGFQFCRETCCIHPAERRAFAVWWCCKPPQLSTWWPSLTHSLFSGTPSKRWDPGCNCKLNTGKKEKDMHKWVDSFKKDNHDFTKKHESDNVNLHSQEGRNCFFLWRWLVVH